MADEQGRPPDEGYRPAAPGYADERGQELERRRPPARRADRYARDDASLEDVVRDPRQVKHATPRVVGGLIAAAVIVFLVVIFVLQNTGEVTIDFWRIEFRAPLWFELVLSFVVGAIVGGALLNWRQRSRRR